MQAIQTKYFGPTDTRGSYFKATAKGGTAKVPYDYNLDTKENHRAAAAALCEKLDWQVSLVGGCLKNQTYAWVLTWAR